MKDLKIPMTFEEFEMYEVPFGWKDEYFNGFAYITPREHGVMMKIAVEKRELDNLIEIKPVSEVSLEHLSKLFYDSFVNSVEYLGQTKYGIKKSSVREINNFFNGERGVPQLDLCKIAVLESKIIGACLISKYKYGFKNEILCIHPKYQRKSIATDLVSSVLNDLDILDEKVFWSEHHICNELSANWHRKFGFVEEPDIMTAKFRLNFYRNEIYRHKKLKNKARLKELNPLLKQAEKEVRRLRKIEYKDFSAAWLSWKYDF